MILYHYCNTEKLQKILSSKVLWLSDLTRSNDKEEVIRTFENLWNNVKHRLMQSDLD